MDLLRIILCVIFPPVGVFLRVGFCGHFLLNVLLTFFGYVPGLIHGIWVFIRYEDNRRVLTC